MNFSAKAVGAMALGAVLCAGHVDAAVIRGEFVPNTGNYDLMNGFEVGLLGHEPVTWKGRFSTTTDVSVSGNKSAVAAPVGNYSGAGYSLNLYGLDVEPNTEYVLSGFFNTKDVSQGRAFLDMWGAEVNINVGASELAYGDDVWQFGHGSFTTGANQTTTLIRLVHDGSMIVGEKVYFDDIGLTKASEFVAPTVVPEPMSVSLVLLGVVGGICRRGGRQA